MNDALYTTSEVGAILGAPSPTIDYWRREGYLGWPEKKDSRWYFTKESVLKFALNYPDRLRRPQNEILKELGYREDPSKNIQKMNVSTVSVKSEVDPEKKHLADFLHKFINDFLANLSKKEIEENPLIYITVAGFDLTDLESVTRGMSDAHDNITSYGQVLLSKGFISGPREFNLDIRW